MGEIISFKDSLIITVFGMLIVFVALLAIAYIIDILRLVVNGREETKKEEVMQKVEEAKETIKEPKETVDDKELIAVISAALAAHLKKDIPQIKIKTIRRVSTPNPLWSEAGIKEQILNRL